MSTLTVIREEFTPAAIWDALAGSPLDDELLDWPPDLFALTEVILGRSEAYRFALSPPGDSSWPPDRVPDWPHAIVAAARRWTAGSPPNSSPTLRRHR
jgi:hypothetical protein